MQQKRNYGAKQKAMKTKRLSLLLALRDGAGQTLTHEADLLTFCNLSENQLAAACRTKLPWAMIKLEWYVLGKRAARARKMGRIPDGTYRGRARRAADR